MEVIKPRPRPDMEEVFETLPDNGPILESLIESFWKKKKYGFKQKTSISQGLAHQHIDDKAKVELPEVYAKYRTVFEKEASERMLE